MEVAPQNFCFVLCFTRKIFSEAFSREFEINSVTKYGFTGNYIRFFQSVYGDASLYETILNLEDYSQVVVKTKSFK